MSSETERAGQLRQHAGRRIPAENSREKIRRTGTYRFNDLHAQGCYTPQISEEPPGSREGRSPTSGSSNPSPKEIVFSAELIDIDAEVEEWKSQYERSDDGPKHVETDRVASDPPHNETRRVSADKSPAEDQWHALAHEEIHHSRKRDNLLDLRNSIILIFVTLTAIFIAAFMAISLASGSLHMDARPYCVAVFLGCSSLLVCLAIFSARTPDSRSTKRSIILRGRLQHHDDIQTLDKAESSEKAKDACMIVLERGGSKTLAAGERTEDENALQVSARRDRELMRLIGKIFPNIGIPMGGQTRKSKKHKKK